MKQRLSGLELIRAHWGILYCSPMFKDDRAFSLLHQDFGIMFPLVPVVKILKKNWGHRENLGESGGQIFKGSDREKCQF